MGVEQAGLRRMKQCGSEKLPAGGGGGRGRKITERKAGLQAGKRFAIQFGVRVDEVIQGIALLKGRKTNVAAEGKQEQIVVVGTEEILSLSRILGGFRGVDGNPTGASRIEFCPAMVAGNVSLGL